MPQGPDNTRPNRDAQIIALLNQLGDRLIRSEGERKEMIAKLNRLAGYEAQFSVIDLRAQRAEQAVQTLQGTVESNARALATRQAQIENRMTEASAQAERIQDIAQRLQDALEQNNRLARKLEQVNLERARMVRKIERIEETVHQTRDALNAKALVLLTDQASAARAVPANMSDTERAARKKFSSLFFPEGWRRWDRGLPAAGVAAMVMLGLFGGWAVQQRLKNSDAPVIAPQTVAQTQPEAAPAATEGALEVAVAPDSPDHPFSENPAQTAIPEDKPQDKLNDIAPAAGPVPENLAAAPEKEEIKTPEMPQAEPASLTAGPSAVKTGGDQFADVDRFVAAQKQSGKLSERIKPDNNLPPVVKEIEKKAFEGVAEAQHDLAAIYTAGHGGVKPDMKKALVWFREAAINGVANARYNLGVLYQQGLGTDRDLEKAVGWYRAAAKLGHPEAQYNLGIAHIEGVGAVYDPIMAAHFFERAARGGIPEAAYNLGLIQENGLIGQPDNKEALFWYNEAAQRGSPEAKAAMDQLLKTMNVREGDIAAMFKGRAGMPPAEKAVKKDKRADAAPTVPREKTDAGKTQTLIAQIQEHLVHMKLYPGPVDGILNAPTADAIRAYQKKAGIGRDGKVSDVLLSHMEAYESTQASAVMPGGAPNEDMPPPGEFPTAR